VSSNPRVRPSFLRAGTVAIDSPGGQTAHAGYLRKGDFPPRVRLSPQNPAQTLVFSFLVLH